MENIYFNSWESILRIIIMTILAYTGLVFLLRSSGKRTLSKMNAFDFVVTVALGSTLATVILSKDISLADGMVALLCLIFLQFIITWTSVRFSWFKRLITSQPALLIYKGEMLHKVLKKERITLEEIHVAVRQKGVTDIKNIDVLILETTGDFTVIPKLSEAKDNVFSNVKHFDEAMKDKD
jgi:uncharacterized membrane protein YcaP (DUF421 family)